MPQSLSQVIIHIVFSTKERRPWLDPEIRPRTHAYLATVCRDCECQAYRVGGTADHVHIAARLARTISQADLLEKIKRPPPPGLNAKAASMRIFSGRQATAISPSVGANWTTWFATSSTRKNIIGSRLSKKNTVSCSRSTKSNTTNGTFGIENCILRGTAMSRAFSASEFFGDR